VVTALDLNIQRICEEALSKSCKRGAMVMVDPNTGDVLAMASWPCYNPNSFVPVITTSEYKALQDDPNIPLLPRAFSRHVSARLNVQGVRRHRRVADRTYQQRGRVQLSASS
jgi:cell division protein FtsI/penicillin-binding protein 2